VPQMAADLPLKFTNGLSPCFGNRVETREIKGGSGEEDREMERNENIDKQSEVKRIKTKQNKGNITKTSQAIALTK